MERITHSKIAAIYGVSRPTLIKWIKNNPALMDSLMILGYYRGRTRILSPGMLKVIKRYLGEPSNTPK